jgi:hypothetical protein
VDEDEQRQFLIEYVARRDRVTIDQAREAFARLSVPDLIRLELEASPRRGGFESEYDPYAYGRD